MSSKRPTVSVVIPAYNEEAVIEQCIESVVNQTIPAYEIIIVDNNSTDKTARIVRRLQRHYPKATIRLLHKRSRQGITPARNHGFNSARGEIIGRLDADSMIEPDWIERISTYFRDHPGIAAITGPVSYHDMPLRKIGLRGDHRIRKVLSVFQGEYQFLFGTNMALRKSTWLAVRDSTCKERVDPKYRDVDDEIFEDIDLSIHISERGFRTMYVPEMVANMSARRLKDSPKDFHRYLMRYNRTYNAHKVRRLSLRVPIIIYLVVYFPGRALLKWYEKDGVKRESLTMAELELKQDVE